MIKKTFCQYSLKCFFLSKVLECIHNTFIIYCDFEFTLIPSTGHIGVGNANNKKYQDHIVCIYGYKLICVDDQYSKPYKIYFGENAIHKFLIDVIKESEYCSKVIETEVNKPPFMTEKDHEDHEFY